VSNKATKMFKADLDLLLQIYVQFQLHVRCFQLQFLLIESMKLQLQLLLS